MWTAPRHGLSVSMRGLLFLQLIPSCWFCVTALRSTDLRHIVTDSLWLHPLLTANSRTLLADTTAHPPPRYSSTIYNHPDTFTPPSTWSPLLIHDASSVHLYPGTHRLRSLFAHPTHRRQLSCFPPSTSCTSFLPPRYRLWSRHDHSRLLRYPHAR